MHGRRQDNGSPLVPRVPSPPPSSTFSSCSEAGSPSGSPAARRVARIYPTPLQDIVHSACLTPQPILSAPESPVTRPPPPFRRAVSAADHPALPLALAELSSDRMRQLGGSSAASQSAVYSVGVSTSPSFSVKAPSTPESTPRRPDPDAESTPSCPGGSERTTRAPLSEHFAEKLEAAMQEVSLAASRAATASHQAAQAALACERFTKAAEVARVEAAAAAATAAAVARAAMANSDELPASPQPSMTFRQRRGSKHLDLIQDAIADPTNSQTSDAPATEAARTFRRRRSSKDLSGELPIGATRRGPMSWSDAVAGTVPDGSSGAEPETFHELHSPDKMDWPTKRCSATELGEEADEAELPFDPALVCSFSCHGIEPSPQGTGQHKVNQDCACVCHPFCSDADCALFCVLDGHGEDGKAVSGYAMDILVDEIERRLLADEAIADAFKRAFEATNEALRFASGVNARVSGACALAVLLHGTRIWCAGAGDCRAVIGAVNDAGDSVAIRLSVDHRPTDPIERQRIEAAGAAVWEGCDDPQHGVEPARVYRDLGQRSSGPGLAMSRCLGDLDDADAGIVPTPDVRYYELSPQVPRDGQRDLFLVLASDGVWEHLSDEEVVRLVSRFHASGQPASVACTNLMASAAMCWRREEGNYRDDITALVAYLPCIGSCGRGE